MLENFTCLCFDKFGYCLLNDLEEECADYYECGGDPEFYNNENEKVVYMISARELRRETEENRRAHYEQLRQRLIDFLEGTEEKIKENSARGYFHIRIRLPQSLFDLPFEDIKNIVDDFYTSFGYKVTWDPKSTTFFFFTVSW